MSIPSVIPHWTDRAPVLSGKLDDPLWREVPAFTDFMRVASGPAQAVTGAQIAYDGEAFYVAFQCKASEESMKVTHTEDGRPVWQDESIELFISPYDAPDQNGFYQFVVNASGAKTLLWRDQILKDTGWETVTSRTEDGWITEMRIPLSVFHTRGRNEAAWRILFCRNSMEFEESSSWPVVGPRFANVWEHAYLLPPEGKPDFRDLRTYLLPLESTGPRGTVVISQAPPEQPAKPIIIPEPVSATFTSARFPLNERTRIIIGQGASVKDRRAAEVLVEWIEKKTGMSPEIIRSLQAGPSLSGSIVIGEPTLNPVTATLLRENRDRVTPEDPDAEGYLVRVTNDWALIAGSDQAGTFWGAQTLAQMIRTTPDGRAWVEGGIIRDKPAMSFRSAHLLTAKDTLEFQSKLIREILSPFKINYVILQMDKFNWKSHPEITDPHNNVTAEDLRELIAIAKDYGITYIPLVMSLGHMEWIFRDGANMDIVEDPETPYAYCPLNERSYELMYDLFTEAYEVFGRPGLFHIGHDEHDMRGRFPYHEECKAVGGVELYYRDTLRLAEFLRQKGARTIMWGDILADEDYNHRLDDLPKDIIIADWRYSPHKEYPTVDMFLEHGFDVVGCTWYVPENIHHFSTYANDRGALGMMQTTWSGWQTADVVLRQWPQQMFQYVLGAEWAWSPGNPSLDAMTYEAEQVFLDRWWPEGFSPDMVQRVEGEMFAVSLENYANISTRDSERRAGWLGTGSQDDFSELRPGMRRLGSVTYNIMNPAGGQASALMLRGPGISRELPNAIREIDVGSRTKQLWFLHCTAYADGPDREVGRYVIRYSDGSSEEIPLIYGRNIMSWKDNRPTLVYQSAWQGKTQGGEGIRLRALPWDNPFPDKEITAIDFIGVEGTQASPVLFAITGIW